MRRHLIHRRRTIEEPIFELPNPSLGFNTNRSKPPDANATSTSSKPFTNATELTRGPPATDAHMTLQRMLVTKQLQRRILRPTHPPTADLTAHSASTPSRYTAPPPEYRDAPQHLSDTVSILRRRHIHPTQHIRTKPRQPARLTPQRPSIKRHTPQASQNAPENLHIPQRIRMPRMINKQHLTVGHNTPH